MPDWSAYGELLKQFPEQHKRILEGELEPDSCEPPPPIRVELHAAGPAAGHCPCFVCKSERGED